MFLDDLNQTFTSIFHLKSTLYDIDDEYESDDGGDWEEMEDEIINKDDGDDEGNIQNDDNGNMDQLSREMKSTESEAEKNEWDYDMGDIGFGKYDEFDDDEDILLFSQYEI